MQLAGNLNTESSLTIRPLSSELIHDENKFFKNNYSYSLFDLNKKLNLNKIIKGIDYNIEYNLKHPYNRNNGTMIPNRVINIL